MSAKNNNEQVDFRDITEVDAVTLVVNTAVIAANSGHGVVVANAKRNGLPGILVWMPNYHHDGDSVKPTQSVSVAEK